MTMMKTNSKFSGKDRCVRWCLRKLYGDKGAITWNYGWASSLTDAERAELREVSLKPFGPPKESYKTLEAERQETEQRIEKIINKPRPKRNSK